MNMKSTLAVCVAGTAVALAVAAAHGGEAANDRATKTSESSVVTNDNGSVSRTFTECNVTTNGNMVTERRRETRTTTDTEGNVLESSTSEYAQSYTVGAEGAAPLFASSRAAASGDDDGEAAPDDGGSFLGLRFGEVYEGTNLVGDADQPTLLRASFEPAKALAGFDDYYVYVTPKTHKVAKVYACAKDTVDPGAGWRSHYLIEALEKRYGTWARRCDFWRPIYAFDIGCGRRVTAFLADASENYGTILAASDARTLAEARDEADELRVEARKKAAKARADRVNAAADAF